MKLTTFQTFLISLALVVLVVVLANQSTPPLQKYNIDTSSITVAGISSGGFMAVQMHFAFSSKIKGASVVAGGPYTCSQGKTLTATTACMTQPGNINQQTLINQITSLQSQGLIDPVSNIQNSKVYLYSGTLDTVVLQGVVKANQQLYQNYNAVVSTQYTIPSEHAWVTDLFGNVCSLLSEPYINNCLYETSQVELQYQYGNLQPAVTQVASNLITFSQSYYSSKGDSLANNGYLYVPTACQKGALCKLHVVFHGCLQNYSLIGTTFVTQTGLNGIAEANNIIILYPQVATSVINPTNPQGCWDFWGYTSSNPSNLQFLTQKGVQMSEVWAMISTLTGVN